VSPRANGPGTGDLIQIIGSGFGFVFESSSIAPEVLVDGQPCDSVEHVSDFQVNCRVPALQGKSLHVAVVVDGQISTESVGYSTAVPTMSSISPVFVLPSNGSLLYSFRIEGSSFSQALIESLSVGSSSCSNITVISQSVMQCSGVVAPSSWPSTGVRMQLVRTNPGSGSESSEVFVDRLLRPGPPPSIQTVVVAGIPVSGGGLIRIVGSGFGESKSDITAVEVEGVKLPLNSTSGWEWESPLELRLVAPPGYKS